MNAPPTRPGSLRLIQERLPAFGVISLLVGALLSLSGVLTHQPAAHEGPAGTATFVPIPISSAGEARALRQDSLAEIRAWPGVRHVTGTGRYGFDASGTRWCTEASPCQPWFLTTRNAASQPPVAVGREPQGPDEILLPRSPEGPELTDALGRTMQITYTFTVAPGRGEPRKRAVQVVGLFDVDAAGAVGDRPAYGTEPLVRELAAAQAGLPGAAFDPTTYAHPQAFVDVDVDAVPALTVRLRDAGFSMLVPTKPWQSSPWTPAWLPPLAGVLAAAAGATAVGVGALIGSSTPPRRLDLGGVVACGAVVAVASVLLGLAGTPWVTRAVGLGPDALPAATWVAGALVGVPLCPCLGVLAGRARPVRRPPAGPAAR